jgi:hypothetical protein
MLDPDEPGDLSIVRQVAGTIIKAVFRSSSRDTSRRSGMRMSENWP